MPVPAAFVTRSLVVCTLALAAAGAPSWAQAPSAATVGLCTQDAFDLLDAQIAAARADGVRGAWADELGRERARLADRCRYRNELSDLYRELARLDREVALGRQEIALLRRASSGQAPSAQPQGAAVTRDEGQNAVPGRPLDPSVHYNLATLHAPLTPGAERTAEWERKLQEERRRYLAERRGLFAERDGIAVLDADVPSRQRAAAALAREVAARRDEAARIERIKAAWTKQRQGADLTSEEADLLADYSAS